jgi:hypothetical protein
MPQDNKKCANMHSSMSRDGNGAPFPDSPRGIHSLGDGDGYNLLPTGN